MKKQYLEIGKIVSTHGLKGDIKVLPWCDDSEFFELFDRFLIGNQKKEYEVVFSKEHKNIMLVHLKGIDTIEDAQKLREEIIYINRDDVELPEGTYFFQDLIGLEVRDADTDKIYGTINDVQHTGANDIYEVRSENNSVWIPAVPQVIEKTDIENNTLLIRPMEGLF